MNRIKRKWRPSLLMVVGGTLSIVLCLPLFGIIFVRFAAPELGYRESVWVAGFTVLLATFLLGYVLWRILLRPIIALRDRAAGVRRQEPQAFDPLDQYGTADMQALGQSVLDMARALKLREDVLRGYADHVTHELKSPLTVIRGAAELLADPDLSDDDRMRLLARIDAATDRMTALLDAQRALAQAREPVRAGRTKLSDVADQTIVEKNGMVPLPRDTLEAVLSHLVTNAQAHGARRIELSFADNVLTIQDDGPGISAGNAARIFEPFFTTRRKDGGTGMGLSIVRRLLEAHGAEISLVTSEQGARFEIVFHG